MGFVNGARNERAHSQCWDEPKKCSTIDNWGKCEAIGRTAGMRLDEAGDERILSQFGGTIGGIPKRSNGADCKSAGLAFAGSNPAPPTINKNNGLRDFNDLAAHCYFVQFAPFLPQTSTIPACHPFLDEGF